MNETPSPNPSQLSIPTFRINQTSSSRGGGGSTSVVIPSPHNPSSQFTRHISNLEAQVKSNTPIVTKLKLTPKLSPATPLVINVDSPTSPVQLLQQDTPATSSQALSTELPLLKGKVSKIIYLTGKTGQKASNIKLSTKGPEQTRTASQYGTVVSTMLPDTMERLRKHRLNSLQNVSINVYRATLHIICNFVLCCCNFVFCRYNHVFCLYYCGCLMAISLVSLGWSRLQYSALKEKVGLILIVIEYLSAITAQDISLI